VTTTVDCEVSEMASGVIVSVVGPVAGREAEFHEWYETVHIPEVLALGHFVRATRYAPRASLPGLPPAPRGHMTIFDLNTDDAQEALDELAAALPSLTMSDSAELGGAYVCGYEPTAI
jgi:hypothetical protein